MTGSAAFVEAEAVASRTWLAWLLTPRVIFGPRHTWLVLPFGGGRAVKLPLAEAEARATLAVAQALLLALALAALAALAACALRQLFRRAATGAAAGAGAGAAAGAFAAGGKAGSAAAAVAAPGSLAALSNAARRRRQMPQLARDDR
jgi:hypothetical protein